MSPRLHPMRLARPASRCRFSQGAAQLRRPRGWPPRPPASLQGGPGEAVGPCRVDRAWRSDTSAGRSVHARRNRVGARSASRRGSVGPGRAGAGGGGGGKSGPVGSGGAGSERHPANSRPEGSFSTWSHGALRGSSWTSLLEMRPRFQGRNKKSSPRPPRGASESGSRLGTAGRGDCRAACCRMPPDSGI